MFHVVGKQRASYCDRVSRRDVLKVGGLAVGGLTLPSLLRAEALAGSRATGKSVINIYLHGGPSHMDMFDLKPTGRELGSRSSPAAASAPGRRSVRPTGWEKRPSA